MGRKGKQIAFGLIVIGAGIVALAAVSFQQNLVYYLTVSEFLERQGDLPSQAFRVDGKVVKGSVARASEGLGVTFAITDGRSRMQVAYARELPDTFKEGGEVVLEGTVDSDGVFRARTLLAKCPSKYEKRGDRHPDEIEIGTSDGEPGAY